VAASAALHPVTRRFRLQLLEARQRGKAADRAEAEQDRQQTQRKYTRIEQVGRLSLASALGHLACRFGCRAIVQMALRPCWPTVFSVSLALLSTGLSLHHA
jgi:hypothetical protein